MVLSWLLSRGKKDTAAAAAAVAATDVEHQDAATRRHTTTEKNYRSIDDDDDDDDANRDDDHNYVNISNNINNSNHGQTTTDETTKLIESGSSPLRHRPVFMNMGPSSSYSLRYSNSSSDDLSDYSSKGHDWCYRDLYFPIRRFLHRQQLPVFTTMVFAATLLVICLAVIQWSPFISNNTPPAIVIHKETIPTLLEVVDPDTGDYLYALDNTIYQNVVDGTIVLETQTASFADSSNGIPPSLPQVAVLPELHLSRNELYHGGGDSDGDNDNQRSLTLTWTPGVVDDRSNGRHRHDPIDVVTEDDLLVLRCADTIEQVSAASATIRHHHDAANTAVSSILEIATIQQARATSAKNRAFSSQAAAAVATTTAARRRRGRRSLMAVQDVHDDDDDERQQKNQWYFPSFPMITHEVCQFTLYHHHHASSSRTSKKDDQKNHYTFMAESEFLLLVEASTTPTAIHLALTASYDTMVVNFVTGSGSGSSDGNSHGGPAGTPIVKYGRASDQQPDPQQKAIGSTDTYTANDLCHAPANETAPGKFKPPGLLHTVLLEGLEPDTVYQYKVGYEFGQGVSWSAVFNFTSAPAPAASTPSSSSDDNHHHHDPPPFTYLVYGDQGCPSQGWGFGSLWTTALAQREVVDNNVRMIHHIGDLSYAQGAAHIWDAWFTMIAVFTPYVPLMVSVGNHEYDYIEGGDKDPSGAAAPYRPPWAPKEDFGPDSGGECGVPTSKRFTMPSSSSGSGSSSTAGNIGSNGVYWYSYDFANVHTTVISTEHDLSPGSVQYIWLENELASVNRTVTPWLIVEGHRPLYESQKVWHANSVGVALRYEVEDLFVDYGVDLVLAGHYHAYLRSCDGLYRSRCNSPHGRGPTYITVGTAGAHLEPASLYWNRWTSHFISEQYGYGRVTVANASALHFEFVKAGDEALDPTAGDVLDDVWVVRERT